LSYFYLKKMVWYVRDTQTYWTLFQCQNYFQNKHSLCGTLMKTGPVRNAQQTKVCVYNIPFDCGRYHIVETARPLEVHIKEHKFALTKRLLRKLKLAPYACE
jgi:hypothetical protein